MTETKTLSDLPIGRRGRVIDVIGDERLQQRLLELGILPGVELTLLRAAPLGDPLEIEVLGYHLSVRRSEARAVTIEVL